MVPRVACAQLPSGNRNKPQTMNKTERKSLFNRIEYLLTRCGRRSSWLLPQLLAQHYHLRYTQSNEPAAAVAKARVEYRPAFKRLLKVTADRPGRDGWEAAKVFDHETAPNKRAIEVGFGSLFDVHRMNVWIHATPIVACPARFRKVQF